MDAKQLVVVALQVSILLTVFGFGLKARLVDLLFLLRRPGLLVRSGLAVFVAMPLLAVLLVRALELRPTVEMALIALSVSPVPPLLPRKEVKAVADASYGLGLMATLAILAVGVVPLSLAWVGIALGQRLTMAPGAVARIALATTLLPLAAGVVVRLLLPRLSQKVEPPVTALSAILLVVAAVPLLVVAAPAMWALVGEGTLFAMLLFTAAGVFIGHAFGGPDRDHAAVLALSTACRHPGMALSIITANVTDDRAAAGVLLYFVISAVATMPYLAWQRQHGRASVRV